MAPLTPGAGCLLLAAAYSAISVMLFGGHHVQALLIVLLGVGGLGLGIQFSALIRHLTTAVPVEYAADISGVSTTALQIGAAIGVAAFGTLYLSLTAQQGASPATHAFAITTAAFAVVALLATATAALTTRQARPPKSRNCDPRAEPGEAGNNGNTRNDASLAPVLVDAIEGIAQVSRPRQIPGRESVAAGPHDSQRQGVYRT
jgi:MFS family permease